MRIIYMDEAGTAEQEKVVVVAAVIVEADKELRALKLGLENLFDQYVPPQFRAGFIFHATDVFSGGRYRKNWELQSRIALFKAVLNLIRDNGLPIAFGYAHRGTVPNDLMVVPTANKIKFPKQHEFEHLMAVSQCAERADRFLRNYLGGRENGMIVAEEITHMKEVILKAMTTFSKPLSVSAAGQRQNINQLSSGRQPSAQILEIRHIVDKPNFAKKNEAPLLQLADICAFSLRRWLANLPHHEDLIISLLGDEGARYMSDPVWKNLGGFSLSNTWKYRGGSASERSIN